jgi:hypothetical protein
VNALSRLAGLSKDLSSLVSADPKIRLSTPFNSCGGVGLGRPLSSAAFIDLLKGASPRVRQRIKTSATRFPAFPSCL